MKRGFRLVGFVILWVCVLSVPGFGQSWSTMWVKGDFNSWTSVEMIEDIEGPGEWFWPFKAGATDTQSEFLFSDDNSYTDSNKIGESPPLSLGDHNAYAGSDAVNIYLGGVTAGEQYIITLYDNTGGGGDGIYDMAHISSFGITGDGWSGSSPGSIESMTKDGDIYKKTVSADGGLQLTYCFYPNGVTTNYSTDWGFGGNDGSILNVPLDTESPCKIGENWPPGGVLQTSLSSTGNHTIAIRPYDRLVYVNQGSDTSLPVQMADFEAVPDAAGVRLVWWTASETNCAGFHIWRSETEDGDYVRVNTVLIPGRGSASGMHEYTFTDTGAEPGGTYYYKIEDVSMLGSSSFYGPVLVQIDAVLPAEFALSRNFPNPFNPETSVIVDVPEAGRVSLRVYDLLGNEVRTIVDGNLDAGAHTLSWNGKDALDNPAPSGLYFIRMEAGLFRNVRKITLIR